MAFGTYKMSTRDADRIQESTGVPPEEMTDEELGQAMDQLGIEKQTITAADQEQASSSEPAAPASQPAPSGGAMTDLDELEKLGQLHEQGILTDEEFTAKKRQILGLD